MINAIINLLAVSIGGTLGAESRYYLTGKIKFKNPIPFGTYIVNVSGSFGLGIFVELTKLLPIPSWLVLFIATGFFGCFTTMSTFAVESLGLAELSRKLAIENIVLMIFSVLLGALLGESILSLIK